MASLAYDNWLFHWNPILLAAFFVGAFLQALITRTLPEGRQLRRMHLGLMLFGVLLDLFARSLPLLGLAKEASVVGEFALLGWGILFIRISGICFFRVFLPKINQSRPRILEEIVFALVCVLWGLIRLRLAGLDLSGLLTTSAVMTAIIAFAMKETLGNVLGGLALQFDNSLQLGDWITVEGISGKVVEVHWRHTAVMTTNGELVVFPNGLLMSAKVVVFSSAQSPAFRRTIQFSTPNSAPPQKVTAAVEAAIRAALIKHVAAQPEPQCLVLDYRDGQIFFGVRYWLDNPLHDISTDSILRKHIYTALKRANLALARPVLDARFSNPSDARNVEKREAETRNRMQMLSVVKLFSGFHENEIRQLALALHVTPFTKNDVITRQGTVAHWLYLLVNGQVDVWHEDASKNRVFITTLEEGAIFGEMGMMLGEPCSTTITARSNVDCYTIDKHTFENILHERPALANQMASIISERNAEWTVQQPGTSETRAKASNHATVLERLRQFFQLPS